MIRGVAPQQQARRNAAGEAEAFDTMLYSEPEIRRIAQVGFEIARERSPKLCSVAKAHVLDTSTLWLEVLTAAGACYPGAGPPARFGHTPPHPPGRRPRAPVCPGIAVIVP